MPRLAESFLASLGGIKPTDRTTMSNSSSVKLPSGLVYLISRLLVCCNSLMADGMERM